MEKLIDYMISNNMIEILFYVLICWIFSRIWK
jgi:hypothetical protein